MSEIPKKPKKKRTPFPIYDARRRSLPESEDSFVELIRKEKLLRRRRRVEMFKYAYQPYRLEVEGMGEFGVIPHRVKWTEAENAMRKAVRRAIEKARRGGG